MKATKQELIKRADDATNERDRWAIFSNAVARGETVSIVRRHPHTLQVARANRAEGGILNYTYAPEGQKPYVSIHNWEAFYQSVTETYPAVGHTESHLLREAVFKMQEIVTKIQNSTL